MNLRLSLVGAAQPLDHVFDAQGGVFGRSGKCHWVLADPDCILSSIHGRIAFANGRFSLVDESTNGIFLDGRSEPLGRGNSVVLQDGLRFRAGSYLIEAQLLRAVQPAYDASPLPVAMSRPVPSPWPDAPLPMSGAPGGGREHSAQHALRDRDEYGGLWGKNSQDPLAYLDGPAAQPGPAATFPPAGSPPMHPSQSLDRSAFVLPPATPVARTMDDGTGLDDLFDNAAGSPPQIPAFPVRPLQPAVAHPAASMSMPAAPAPLPVATARPATIPEDFLAAFAPRKHDGPPQTAAPARAPSLPDAARPAAVNRIPDDFDPLTSIGVAARGAGPQPVARPAEALAHGARLPAVDIAALLPSAAARPQPQPLSPALRADIVTLSGPGIAAGPLPAGRGGQAFDPLEALKSRREERKAALIEKANSTASPMPTAASLPSHSASAGGGLPPVAQPSPGRDPAAAPIPLSGDAGGPALARAPADAAVIAALLAGMGFPAARVAPEDHGRLAEELGAMVRETAEGLVALLSARRMLKAEFRMDETQIKPEENNPFKYFKIAELALDELFLTRSGGYQPPAEAAASAFQDLQQHVMLTMSAMQRAINLLFKRLAPETMARDSEEEGGLRIRGLGARKGKWETYVESHARMSGNIDGISRQIIAEAFAQVQEEQARKAASAYWENKP